MRLIDADALLDHQFKNDISYNAFRSLVKRQATIDAVPVKHGEWKRGKCSLCGEHAPFWSMASTYYESAYCPNCGAKMDGEKDDE